MSSIIKKIISLIVFSFVVISTAKSDENPDFVPSWNLGFYLGGNYNMHTPNFEHSNYVTSAPTSLLFDQNGTGLGFNGGFIINYPINSIFTFSGRVGYNMLSGEFEGVNQLFMNEDKLNFISNQGLLEISPTMQFHNLLPLKRLYFVAGLETGIPLLNSHIIERQFDGQEVFQESDIPESAFRMAAILGLGYTFNLGTNTFLSPEVSYRLPFTQVSNSANYDSWQVPQVRLGISLTFGFGNKEKEQVETSLPPMKVGFKDVRGYDNDGNPYSVSKIRVEEVQYTELFPIVPYIFFDENQDVPNQKQQVMAAQSKAGQFTIESLEPNAFTINKNTIDIVGARMQKFPNATLTITGTNDNQKEKGNKNISQSRADFAKNYLIVNYGINPNKVETKSVGLPSKPASQRDKDGVAENRRLEFTSDFKEILQPILIEKDKQTVTDPRLVEFVPSVETANDTITWELEVVQAGRTLERFEGEGVPEAITWSITPNQLTSKEIPVEYTFYAKNAAGQKASKSGSIPIEFFSSSNKSVEEKTDKVISKYSLMLFDFDSEKISNSDKELLDKIIIPSIKYNSTVQIFGHTDRIGDADYNKKLSVRRADEVKKYLESKLKSVKLESFGAGESIELFDNNSPIGRSLSRTVQIYVITPKEK